MNGPDPYAPPKADVEVLSLGVIPYVLMERSPRRQRLGDRWAHTVVVRVETLPPGARGGLGVGLVLGCFVNVTMHVVWRVLTASAM